MEYPHLRDCEESFNKTLLSLSTKENKNLYKGFTNILPDLCASCDGICLSCFPQLLTQLPMRRSGEVTISSLHIIFPTLPYAEALVEAGVDSLFNRRQILTTKLFNDIVNDESHKLYQLLPSKNFSNYNMRKENIFNVSISRTNRFKNSFIQHNSTMYFR